MKLDETVVALVTGGAGGIGRELARALLLNGCSCAIADISHERLQETRTALCSIPELRRGQLSVHHADLSVGEECSRLVSEVLEAHGGRLSLLINNAGIVAADALERMSIETFRWPPNSLCRLSTPNSLC